MTTGKGEDLAGLRDCTFQSVGYSLASRELEFTFEHWDGSRVSVCLRGVLHLSISNLDENSGAPLVLKARVENLEDGGKEELGSLGYLWRKEDGGVPSYPGVPLILFNVDGDVCVAVVCHEFDMKRVAGSPGQR